MGWPVTKTGKALQGLARTWNRNKKDVNPGLVQMCGFCAKTPEGAGHPEIQLLWSLVHGTSCVTNMPHCS